MKGLSLEQNSVFAAWRLTSGMAPPPRTVNVPTFNVQPFPTKNTALLNSTSPPYQKPRKSGLSTK